MRAKHHPSSRLSPITRWLALVYVAAAILTSCTSSGALLAPDVDPAWSQGAAPEADHATLIHGRTLYLTRCQECHAGIAVHDYTQAQWSAILPEMIDMSELNPRDSQAVTAYVNAALKHGGR